jgi:hypothetical protein
MYACGYDVIMRVTTGQGVPHKCQDPPGTGPDDVTQDSDKVRESTKALTSLLFNGSNSIVASVCFSVDPDCRGTSYMSA